MVPSAQSQARGHGEGGGVQYQTLNSEIAHILGREVGVAFFADFEGDFPFVTQIMVVVSNVFQIKYVFFGFLQLHCDCFLKLSACF